MRRLFGLANDPDEPTWTLELGLEPRDAWVGLFWDRRGDTLHVYVCPLPFVVMHLEFRR